MSWTGSDLAEWLSIPNPTVDELAEMTRILTVSESHIAERVSDVTAEPVQQAILMHAARLWKRRNSPEGTIDMGDFVGSVKSWDADIESLIAPYRKWSFGVKP